MLYIMYTLYPIIIIMYNMYNIYTGKAGVIIGHDVITTHSIFDKNL